ncbi:BnaC03g62870D [Brassica napus]|uniref:BnaC03g62870D protein n=1 Tax=Brassica napus TaxID=3708 RepID=A0A078F827_BRANA|nr:BnaC03g62870D [Brassica napus]
MTKEKKKDNVRYMNVEFNVSMHCNECERKIARVISKFKGVETFTTDMNIVEETQEEDRQESEDCSEGCHKPVKSKAQKLVMCRYKVLELVMKKLLNQTDTAEFVVAFAGIQDAIHQFLEILSS